MEQPTSQIVWRSLDLEYKTNNKSNKNKKKEYTLSTYLLPRFSLSFILSVDLKSDLKIRIFNREAVLKVCLSRIMGDIMKISSSNMMKIVMQ